MIAVCFLIITIHIWNPCLLKTRLIQILIKYLVLYLFFVFAFDRYVARILSLNMI